MCSFVTFVSSEVCVFFCCFVRIVGWTVRQQVARAAFCPCVAVLGVSVIGLELSHCSTGFGVSVSHESGNHRSILRVLSSVPSTYRKKPTFNWKMGSMGMTSSTSRGRGSGVSALFATTIISFPACRCASASDVARRYFTRHTRLLYWGTIRFDVELIIEVSIATSCLYLLFILLNLVAVA